MPTASAAPGRGAGAFELGSSAGVTSTREQEPVVVDPELRLTGPAGRLVRGAVVRIAEGATGSDELLFDDQGAIDGSFAGRRLLLRGSAPARIYQRALRSVEFVHRGDEPGSPSTTRSIRFKLIGNPGAAASKALEVVAVDGAPQVTMARETLELATGAGAVALDPSLSILDIDSASLSGATVTVRGGAAGPDVLTFAAMRGITGAVSSTGVLTLSGAASVADYQAALRTVTYRSSGTAAGERTVEVVVRDTSGTAGSATRRVRLTASAAQSAAQDDVATVLEDSGATNIDVLANDTAPAGTSLRIASVTQPLQGTVTTDGTTVSYRPAANHCTSTHGLPTYPFTYTLATGQTATVRVTVTCVDDNPTAVDDAFTVLEDSGATVLAVQTNDRDVDGGPRRVGSVSQPRHGTVTLVEGVVAYAPERDYCTIAPDGPDTFTYTLVGGSTATVAVTVTCVAEAPTSYTLEVEEGPAFHPIDDLLATIAADRGADVVGLEGPEDPNHGGVIFDPENGSIFRAAESFCNSRPGGIPVTFVADLADGGTATISVTVTCRPPRSSAPQANDDSYFAGRGSLVVAAPGLLVNDTAGEGETLKVVGCTPGVGDPLPGQLTCYGLASNLEVNEDGSLVYSSFLSIDLTEVFTYAIEDSQGRRSTAQVVIRRQGPIFGF